MAVKKKTKKLNETDTQGALLQDESSKASRLRTWTCILYPDTESYIFDDVLVKIQESVEKYYVVCHNKDGVKEHYHCVLRFKEAKTQTAVCSLLGLNETRFLQDVHDLRGAIRYLFHLDNPTKAQYSTDECLTNDKESLSKYTGLVEEGSIVLDMLEKLDNGATFRQLLKYACESGHYSEFRRNFNILYTIGRKDVL